MLTWIVYCVIVPV